VVFAVSSYYPDRPLPLSELAIPKQEAAVPGFRILEPEADWE